MLTRIPYQLVLWTVLADYPTRIYATRTDDPVPAPIPIRAGAAALRHGSSSTLWNQRLRRGGKGGGRGFTSRKNRRRGGQVTGLNSRPGRPRVVRRGPRPSSPSCGVDRPYRKPGLHPKEYKSQGGEDAFLNRHFNGTRVGTYLDIGCNDGIDGSNTFYFQQRGWQGVCVEADPAKFLQIHPHSSRRDGVNLAIADRSSCLTFARVHDSNSGLSGIVSTLDVERASVFGITRINVTAISPLELLGRYYAHVPVLDYASVDVEGAELTIMGAWPFEKWCVN